MVIAGVVVVVLLLVGCCDDHCWLLLLHAPATVSLSNEAIVGNFQLWLNSGK